MPAASREAWAHHASGQADADQAAADVAAHATETRPAGPPSPRPSSRRSFAARVPGRPGGGRLPSEHRPDRHQDGSARTPAPGHPQGIPEFPEPLPGSHHYPAKPEVPLRQALDVGPAEPYYAAGMAHGVPAPETHHGGRPAPRPEDRARYQATRAAIARHVAEPPDPVPVYMVQKAAGTKPLKRAAFRRILVPAPGADPVLLVPKDPRRLSVRLLCEGAGEAGAPADTTLSVQSSVTSPGSGANISGTIAAVNLPAGIYQVTAQVYLDGTIAAGTDDDNMKINQLNGAQTHLLVPAVAGIISTTTFQLAFNGAQSINILSVNAGTASSVYHAALQVTRVSPSGNDVRIHADPGTLPAGDLLPAGAKSYLQVDTEDQIWAVADPAASGPTWVSVISQYQISGAI